jgi:hypothetical protein
MKWQAKGVLILVSVVAIVASAQSSAPLPDVTVLVRQAILQQRFAELKEQDYVFREDVGSNKLRKECTWAPRCPAPAGVPGVRAVSYLVLSDTTRHFEIFWLDGIRVARILPEPISTHTNDAVHGDWTMAIPTSDSELAVENQRVDSEVAEAKALRAQGKDASSPDDPPQILFSRILKLCAFSNSRRQVVEGRSTILLDFVCNPSGRLANMNEALLRSFSGTARIDEEDHAVQQMEGRFLSNVNLNGGNVKIRKGTHIEIVNRRVDRGIWLLSGLVAWGEARYFSFTLDGQGYINAGNYRKFRAISRILPGFAEVPANSPAPPLPKPPQPPVAITASSQSTIQDRSLAQETQARGYWVDPSTGLMWAGKDNGKDVTWRQATKYCHDLRLAGHSDWRLATLDELASLVDKSASTPERAGNTETLSINGGRHVRGNLSLTGDPWSSNRDKDRFGHPYGDGDFFDFVYSKPSGDLPYFRNTKYALCVRRSGE